MRDLSRGGNQSKRGRNPGITAEKGGVSQVLDDKRHTPLQEEWPPKDQIRWAEWNLEVLVSRPDLADERERLPKRMDLEIWLLHKRDQLSLRQLSRRFYGCTDSRAVSRIRRSVERVERRHPGTSKFVGPSKSEQRILNLLLSGVVVLP